jgi:hypothetical protein
MRKRVRFKRVRSYNLNIAGYNIRIVAADDGPDLLPSERFRRSINNHSKYDVIIKVHHGTLNIPEDAERVLVAPYSVEVKGYKVNKKDNFWSVYRRNSDLFLITNFPDSPTGKRAMMKFSLIFPEWDLWLENAGASTDPLDYPLDGLVLYYLTAINADIMIHASGICYDTQGYIFSGVSGKGKSTLAGIWDNVGAQVVHDDRLIIRNIGGMYWMFNTPVNKGDVPRSAPVNKIYIIEHGIENSVVPLRESSAITSVISNSIQHNYDPEMIARFLGSISLLCSKIPVSRLSFRPDRSVIEYILKNDFQQSYSEAFEGHRFYASF